MGISLDSNKEPTDEEIWKRTEIVETFDPKAFWDKFTDMSSFAQSDWVHKNPNDAVKLFWYLDNLLRSYERWIDKYLTKYG